MHSSTAGVRSDCTCSDTGNCVWVVHLVHVCCRSVCEFCWSAGYALMWWVPQKCSVFSDVSSVGVLRVLRCEFHWSVMLDRGVRRFGYRLLVTRWKHTSLRSSSFAQLSFRFVTIENLSTDCCLCSYWGQIIRMRYLEFQTEAASNVRLYVR